MKRRFLIPALAILSFAFALTAQANVFTNPENYGGTANPTHYKVQFDGFEFAHLNSSDNFLSGQSAYVVDQKETLLNADGTLRYDLPDREGDNGITLTGVYFATNIIQTSTHEGPGRSPTLYNGGSTPGAYVAFLKDVRTVGSDGAVDVSNQQPAKTANIYFSGGVLEWYYLPNYTADDLTNLYYEPGTEGEPGGLYTSFYDGRESARLDMSQAEHIVSLAVDQEEHRNGATVSYKEGALNAKNNMYTNVVDDPYGLFDNNLYGSDLYDSHLSSNLNWYNGEKSFYSDGIFRISTRATPTPEPNALILMSMGLVFIGSVALRQRRARS